MDKPKKEPILLNQKQDYKLCLNCGFPNRQADTHCMYCNTAIVEDTGILSWLKQTYYVLRWRWQLKQKRENLNKESRFSFMRAMGFFALGVGLSCIGLYVFSLSISNHSFTNGLVALLLLGYGIFTLKTLFTTKK